MNLYEGMFILNSLLRPEETDKLVADIEGEMKKLKGEVVETKRLGKKMMAYPINKHNEGVYLLIFFKVEPTSLDALNKKLHLNENIWRILFLQSDEEAMKNAVLRTEEPRREYEDAPER